MRDSITSRTTDTARRVHSMIAEEELTVYQYSWDETGGSNEYADGDWTVTTSTVTGSVRLPENVDFDDNITGSESEHDVNIFVNPENVNIVVGDDDETRATEFEDSNGRRYRVIGYADESSLYEVACREIDES